MFALLTNSSKRLPRMVCVNIEAKDDGGGESFLAAPQCLSAAVANGTGLALAK